ncbi:inner membrane transporter RhtA [Kutzneria viridogrisea]|nr:EamA family transporter [Kutzneria albida]MBA8925301.1 inner membrane transporter RhtA [Kutzneria viridogrisea]
MVMAQAEGTPGRWLPRWAALPQLAGQAMGSIPPTGLLLGGMVSVQFGAAVAKDLFPLVGAAGTAGVRLVFAAVFLLVLWRPTLKLGRKALPVVLGYGAVLGLMNLMFYEALARLPLGIAVTIEFLGPLAVALAGSRRWLDVLWALLAGAGVALLTRADGGISFVGLLFVLGAATCWALYILIGAKLGEVTSGGSGLALSMTVGALIVAPFSVAEAGGALLSPLALLAGAGVAVLSSVIPYSLELEALRKIPPRLFGVLMSVEPALGALAGVLLLGEHLGGWQWAAIVCVVAASAGATWTARRR